MTLSRRKMLALVGGGTILAATGTGAGFLVTRMPTKALEPWSLAGSYGEVRRDALSYALLAPNPHNRQPWVVDLDAPDQVTLYADPDRLLPHTDPFSRQIVIGLGCFLEVMRMAASHAGYRVDIQLFPEGEDPQTLDNRPIAVARFASDTGVTPDPLFAQVPFRRTLKDPFDMARPVDDQTLRTIAAAARSGTTTGITNDPDQVAQWRALTREALRIEIETPHTYKESVDLFRIGRAEIEANPDGIDFSGPMFETLALTGMFTREIALDTSSMAYQQGLDAVYANVDTAMGHIWTVTPANTRTDQIRAGFDWVRLNLAATALGVGMQPLSQALQEYPEMSGPYAGIHRRLAPGGGTVQMFARVGYGATPSESPRWPLETRIADA